MMPTYRSYSRTLRRCLVSCFRDWVRARANFITRLTVKILYPHKFMP